MPQSSSLFPPTRWTMVALLDAEKPARKETAWNELAKVYQPALVRFLQSRQVTASDAQDLVQGLFLKLWKNHQSASPLGPDRGSLRSFLLQSLLNHQRSSIRDAQRQKRGGKLTLIDLDSAPHLTSPAARPEEEFAFDQEWAVATVTTALDDLSALYHDRNNTPTLQACLQLLQDDNPALRQEICKQLKTPSNSLTVTFKRFRTRLGNSLRATIAETLVNPTDFEIDTEVRNLLRSFESTGGFHNLPGKLSPRD